MSFRTTLCTVALLTALTPALTAQTATIEATFDRWNYPFNAAPGSRLNGTTFGAIGNPQFDDYDAQLIVGFDTAAAGIPNHGTVEVQAVTMQLTVASDNTFEYDPTYDPISTYLDPATDADTGRPVEMYGLGLRSGFLFASFGPHVAGPIAYEQAESFGFGNPASERVRIAFMSDHKDGARDVSNHVAEGFDTVPWAVGTLSDITPGATVPLNSVMNFDIDLTDPDVLDYVQRGISSGGLFFTLGSLHRSTQGSSAGIPSFFLSDPNLPDLDLAVAELSIDYQIVPEPSAASLLAISWIGMIAQRRTRRRRVD